jgi:hypothetical protein
MINLDPSIIDQESVRKKRRKKLMLYAAAPVVIILIAGLFFIRPGVFNILYNMNYNNADAGFNIFISNLQTKANIIEPYIAHYNAGTAYIKDNDGAQAEIELRSSLRSNPPADKVCQVRTNLAYSIEMQADQETVKGNYGEALVLYSASEGILYGDNCASKDNSESRDKKAGEAKKRISQKRGKITSEMNGQGEDGEESNPYTETQINEGQLQELRNNLMNGLDIQNYSRQKQFSESSGTGSGSIPKIRHW